MSEFPTTKAEQPYPTGFYLQEVEGILYLMYRGYRVGVQVRDPAQIPSLPDEPIIVEGNRT